MCITFTRYHLLHPEDHIPRDAAVLFAKKLEDVVLAVPEREVHADEGRVRKGQNEGVQLRVVRVALALRGGVELVAGRAEKGDLVDDGLVLWQDLPVPLPQQANGRVPRKENQAFLVPLRDAQGRGRPFRGFFSVLPVPFTPSSCSCSPFLNVSAAAAAAAAAPAGGPPLLQELPQLVLGQRRVLGLESRLGAE